MQEKSTYQSRSNLVFLPAPGFLVFRQSVRVKADTGSLNNNN